MIIMINYDGDSDDNEYLRRENMFFNITQTLIDDPWFLAGKYENDYDDYDDDETMTEMIMMTMWRRKSRRGEGGSHHPIKFCQWSLIFGWKVTSFLWHEI